MPKFPGFTQKGAGEATENEADEANILLDQDLTKKSDLLVDDENMGASSNSLEPLEDEPADFMRGEIDVKEQMDRAADALDSSIHGYISQADEDSPRSELGASFKNTPGGIEEVEMKTDEELATHRIPTRNPAFIRPDKNENTHHGHKTGALTDIGAGRSAVTRSHPHETKH